MCLALVALKAHNQYPLVVGLNRDEFYSRKSEPVHRWKESPEILAGKDVQQGTWMGVTFSGRLAMVTNFRDPKVRRDAPRSRGLIATDFLVSQKAAEEFLSKLNLTQYNPFNLILGCLDELLFYSSRSVTSLVIPPGIHGLSNGNLNEPWPKVVRGKQKLESVLKGGTEISPYSILEILADPWQPPDSELPNTGVGLERERALAPIFISSPERDYFTRCSTVLLFDSFGKVTYSEKIYSRETESKIVEHTFHLNHPETLESKAVANPQD